MKQHLHLWQIISLGIGSIVGAGIFVLLGQVLQEAGPFTYYSFLVSGIIAMLCGYAYTKLAIAYPTAGGITDYFHQAFPNKWISGTLSLIYVITALVASGAMAKSFGMYLMNLRGPYHDFSANILAVGLLLILGALNMARASSVGKAETFLVGLKITILFALIIAGFVQFTSYQPAFHQVPSTTSFLRSIGLTFFAFAGFGVITNATAYVQNPSKTIGLAMFLTLFFVMILYMSLTFIIINFISPEAFNRNVNIAIATVAKELLGGIGHFFIYMAAVMAFITGISANFFSVFRISQSLSEQGILPEVYKRHFIGRGTYGNVITLVLLVILTVSVDFTNIVNISSIAYLVSYLGVFLSAFILRKETKAYLFPIIFGFGLMFSLLVGFVYSVYC